MEKHVAISHSAYSPICDVEQALDVICRQRPPMLTRVTCAELLENDRDTRAELILGDLERINVGGVAVYVCAPHHGRKATSVNAAQSAV